MNQSKMCKICKNCSDMAIISDALEFDILLDWAYMLARVDAITICFEKLHLVLKYYIVNLISNSLCSNLMQGAVNQELCTTLLLMNAFEVHLEISDLYSVACQLPVITH